MVIAVDFDGTCTTNKFPDIGQNIGAQYVLKRLLINGHDIVLNTVRSSRINHRDILKEAVEWFIKQGISLYGINEIPGQKEYSSSPKVNADLYIDDHSLGIPLIRTIRFNPFVDWIKASYMLQEMNLIKESELLTLIPHIMKDLKEL